ncbi:unnamed protein product [Prorocentrum cordatum]|uniref:Uncharacterized protein n=1 Tax=Prorocentrum cordatum TaxID=2364126 RepID=A0ABN9SQ73_9DINO|nr:unnamed protein product [Polarella glacialis]
MSARGLHASGRGTAARPAQLEMPVAAQPAAWGGAPAVLEGLLADQLWATTPSKRRTRARNTAEEKARAAVKLADIERRMAEGDESVEKLGQAESFCANCDQSTSEMAATTAELQAEREDRPMETEAVAILQAKAIVKTRGRGAVDHSICGVGWRLVGLFDAGRPPPPAVPPRAAPPRRRAQRPLAGAGSPPERPRSAPRRGRVPVGGVGGGILDVSGGVGSGVRGIGVGGVFVGERRGRAGGLGLGLVSPRGALPMFCACAPRLPEGDAEPIDAAPNGRADPDPGGPPGGDSASLLKADGNSDKGGQSPIAAPTSPALGSLAGFDLMAGLGDSLAGLAGSMSPRFVDEIPTDPSPTTQPIVSEFSSKTLEESSPTTRCSASFPQRRRPFSKRPAG